MKIVIYHNTKTGKPGFRELTDELRGDPNRQILQDYTIPPCSELKQGMYFMRAARLVGELANGRAPDTLPDKL